MPYSSVPALRFLARRGIVITLLARAATAVAVLFAAGMMGRGAPRVSLQFAPLTAIVFAGVCGALMLVEGARQGDSLFFANLGVHRWQMMLCGAAPALVLEAIIGIVL